jgi:hypothetical protein
MDNVRDRTNSNFISISMTVRKYCRNFLQEPNIQHLFERDMQD